MPLTKEMCSETDVVEEHHCWNSFPHAPDPQRLHNIHQQLSGNSVAPLPQETPLNKDLSTPCPNTEGPVADASNGSSVPPAELSGTTTKLRSYPYKFCEVIEWAKQFAQCSTAIDPFPSQAWFIDKKSSAYITEVIAERNEQGVFIPPGTSHVTSMNWPSLMIDRILATLLQRPGHSHKFFYLPVTRTNMFSSFGKH